MVRLGNQRVSSHGGMGGDQAQTRLRGAGLPTLNWSKGLKSCWHRLAEEHFVRPETAAFGLFTWHRSDLALQPHARRAAHHPAMDHPEPPTVARAAPRFRQGVYHIL